MHQRHRQHPGPFVGAAAVWLIGLIAWRSRGARAGVAAAVVAAVYPPLVWMCAYALSETLFSLLALAAAIVLDIAMHRALTHRAGGAGVLAAGLLAGAATLVRPVMLLFLPLALLWMLRRGRPAGRRVSRDARRDSALDRTQLPWCDTFAWSLPRRRHVLDRRHPLAWGW
jgi:4-amino-4-deoxy-L-arabinose transferase-like glycosyltransferase